MNISYSAFRNNLILVLFRYILKTIFRIEESLIGIRNDFFKNLQLCLKSLALYC